MNKDVASLIIRMDMALTDEGVGPRNYKPGDAALIKMAVSVAGEEFDDHILWDYNLVSDKVHIPRCTYGYRH